MSIAPQQSLEAPSYSEQTVSRVVVPFLTPEARRYAVKELARRAGVAREFFNRWTIEVNHLRTIITLPPKGEKIYFEHLPPIEFNSMANGKLAIGKSRWLRNPGNSLVDVELLTPFAPSENSQQSSLFTRAQDDSFVCRVDLLLSLLFTLTRVEETLSGVRDDHGRFPSSASVATRCNFLERPIVDELGLAFEQVLRAILPAWHPSPRALRINVTHDIDDIGIPFQLSTTLAHTLKRKRPSASFQDLAATFSNCEPAELAQVRRLARISKARGLKSSFFWKASRRTPQDSGYDLLHPKVQRVIADLKDQGCEVGVHPGYDTYQSQPALGEEIQRLRIALGVQKLGGRQHYLRWSPQTWRDWEACTLHYDSSVGFADHFGFRAGTAWPYRPWSFAENRELDVIEVPLILMDCTPVKYMSLPKHEAIARIHTCIKRTAAVGGVFTLLWHNTPLLNPDYNSWYESILDLLPPAPALDLSVSSDSLWL